MLLPAYENAAATYLMPATLGKLAFILWLVIKGAKSEAFVASAA